MEGLKLATKMLTGGVVALLATACAVPDDDPLEGSAWRSGDDADGGVIIEPPPGEEPLTGSEDGGGGGMGGDWIVNGLSDPHVSGVKVNYPLDSPEGLGAEGWLADGDPEGEKVIRYLVECALDEADSITVVGATNTWVFWGDVGLAPEWEDHPCDTSCQQWVSACLLARVNETGADVKIFVQGDHENLGYGSDPEYPNYEGTFFGNVFYGEPAPMHACRGSSLGTAAAIQQGRNCTLSEENCGFTTYSSCDVAAGCELGAPGLPTVDCQPVAGGPIFPGIAVHVRTP
jgi:hypothetical protein